MALFDNTSFRLLEKGLDGVWYKMQVTAQNITNVDTPNYKAKKVSFETLLQEETCKCVYHPDDGTAKNGQPIDFAVVTTSDPLTNQTLNENNVDMELEQANLLDQQYQYSQLINQINNEFNMIKASLAR